MARGHLKDKLESLCKEEFDAAFKAFEQFVKIEVPDNARVRLLVCLLEKSTSISPLSQGTSTPTPAVSSTSPSSSSSSSSANQGGGEVEGELDPSQQSGPPPGSTSGELTNQDSSQEDFFWKSVVGKIAAIDGFAEEQKKGVFDSNVAKYNSSR
jgi:hypothetical protein